MRYGGMEWQYMGCAALRDREGPRIGDRRPGAESSSREAENGSDSARSMASLGTGKGSGSLSSRRHICTCIILHLSRRESRAHHIDSPCALTTALAGGMRTQHESRWIGPVGV